MANDAYNVDLLFRMVAHWIGTKPFTYLGSSYGAPTEELLQKPLSSPIADSFLAKMRDDIPVLAALPAGVISMYAENDGIDRQYIYIDIDGSAVSLSDLGDVKRGSY